MPGVVLRAGQETFVLMGLLVSVEKSGPSDALMRLRRASPRCPARLIEEGLTDRVQHRVKLLLCPEGADVVSRRSTFIAFSSLIRL